VGFGVTADGISTSAPYLTAAWAASDVIAVSYLPLDSSAHVRPTSEVGADIDRILSAAPADKPLIIHEAGFPTATACGADPSGQATFVRAMFAAWDKNAARIPLLTFRELVDAPEEVVSALAARRGRNDGPFLAFLGSLGLRSADGVGKAGWDAFLLEARARGF
jgi:hypothetical protein